MKKVFYLSFAILFIASLFFVNTSDSVLILRRADVGADCTYDLSGSNSDSITGTNFDSEQDPVNTGYEEIALYSNAIRLHIQTTGNDAYGVESSGCFSSNSEATLKFKIKFDDITAIDSGEDDLIPANFRNSTPSTWAESELWTYSGTGDLDSYNVNRGPFDETSDYVHLSGIAIDTWYQAYFYANVHSTDGTVSLKIGDWAEVNTGSDNTSSYSNINQMEFGGRKMDWDGASDSYVHFKDIEVWLSDERPIFCDESTASGCEDFNVADNDDVDSVTDFDNETDSSSYLQIVEETLEVDMGTTNSNAYLHETSVVSNASEVTIKFKILFTYDDAVANGVDDMWPIYLYDNAGSQVQGWAEFWTNGSGDIATYRTVTGNYDIQASSVTMTNPDLAANTWYNGYYYFKKDASGTTAIKIGPWAETAGNYNTSSYNGVGQILFGTWDQDWGDGTNDSTVKFKDFEVYLSDAR